MPDVKRGRKLRKRLFGPFATPHGYHLRTNCDWYKPLGCIGKRSGDKFDVVETVTTEHCARPREIETSFGMTRESVSVFLRSFVPKDEKEEPTFQVYVQYFTYGRNGRFLTAIPLVSGKPSSRKLTQIGYSPSCSGGACNYTWDFGFNLTYDELVNATAKGIEFKLQGNEGQVVATLPRNHIDSVLNEVFGSSWQAP